LKPYRDTVLCDILHHYYTRNVSPQRQAAKGSPLFQYAVSHCQRFQISVVLLVFGFLVNKAPN